MKVILVFNGGSSSIKFSMYTADSGLTLLYDGEVYDIGTSQPLIEFYEIKLGNRLPIPIAVNIEELRSYSEAVLKIATTLDQLNAPRPLAIGHRVTHPGPILKGHSRVTKEVFEQIEQSTSFAPLHQPIALEIMRAVFLHFPDVENYACFDTIFHQSMPLVASTYPIPKDLREKGLHRYGFHGLSCESILQQFRDGRVAELLPPGKVPGRLIVAHLGNGASITAIKNGTSIDTTMGLTPCGGILMGSRSGDLDPGLILCLMRMLSDASDNPVDAIEKLLNKQSGLVALSGLSNDLRLLREANDHGSMDAALAIEMFVLNVKKTIGGFIALLGGLDALVFTGGIGENDALIRSEICDGLTIFGIIIDPVKNISTNTKFKNIGPGKSLTPVFVMHSEEDRMIAIHLLNILNDR